MGIIGQFMLFAWIPACVGSFLLLPTRRAIVASSVLAWFFLPCGGFSVAGLPDYTKSSAVPLGLILGLLATRPAPLFSFRPAWYDLPVFVLGTSIIASDLSYGDSFYTSVSDTLLNLSLWTVPYCIARCYLADLQGVREIGLWLVIATLIYLPLCLYESWAGPFLSLRIYKFTITYAQTPRLGLGYRPILFMTTGLEIAMYFTATLLLAFCAWRFGRVRILQRFAPGWLVGVMVFANVMIKSIGALQLGAGAMVLLELLRRTRSTWLLVVLALSPFLYEYVRINKIWTGDTLVEWNQAYFGDERASSLKTRFDQEKQLIDKAMLRPLLGWGGNGRNRVVNGLGVDITLTDGLWIIALGAQGLVGMISVTATLVLPALLYAWRVRQRPELLDSPEWAALLAMVVFLAILMLDQLANAFPGPVYGLMCGASLGILGQDALPAQRGAGRTRRERADALARAGEVEAAMPLYQQAAAEFARAANAEPREPAHRVELAACDDALATLLDRSDPGDAAIGLRLRALALREALANDNPTHPGARRDLADALAALGRSFRAAGRTDEAREAWLRVLEVWDTLEAAAAHHPELADARAEAFNDAAWALVGHPDRHADDLPLAVDLARRAVEFDNTRHDFWNTLGTAYYHASEWDSAITSLRAACDLSDGGTAYDHFLLAMAHQRRGAAEAAVAHYQRAVDWITDHGPGGPDLDDLHREAYGALGLVEAERAV